jgi:hypothetical protein
MRRSAPYDRKLLFSDAHPTVSEDVDDDDETDTDNEMVQRKRKAVQEQVPVKRVTRSMSSQQLPPEQSPPRKRQSHRKSIRRQKPVLDVSNNPFLNL